MARDLNADLSIGMTPRQQVTASQIMPQPKPSMVGGLLGAGIDLAQNSYNNKVNNQNIANMQGIYDQQIAAARPGNISGGAVNVNYDPNANTLNVANNPQLQGLIASQYAQQGGLANQLANLDPFALGEYIYNQGSESRNLDQARQTNQALERLQATGMLSSSSGNQLQGELAQSQSMANAQERATSMMQGQEIANAIANRQNAAISNIYGADALSQNAIQNAINMGVEVTPPTSLSSAYQNQADAKQGFASETGSSLSDMLGLAGSAVGGPIGGMLGSAVGSLFG